MDLLLNSHVWRMERSLSEHTLQMSKPDNFRVQSATEWTASVHTLHMSKPVITFVFKVLRNGLLRHILLHMSKPDNVRVQSATE